MRDQLSAIIQAQLRITRNHFPRTSFGVVLSRVVTGLWYLVFVILAMLTARALEHAPPEYLPLSVSAGLLAVFAYMQAVPLATASTGWSLEIGKLQAFPIPANTLFLIEAVLRLTSAPEMLIMLCGGLVGLLLRPDIFWLAPFCLLLLLPFSLLIQLAIRDFVLHSFARNRLREAMIVVFLAFLLLPQILIRENKIMLLKPYALMLANGRATPWREIAMLSLGHFSLDGLAAALCWNLFAAILARRQFMKSLRHEDSFRNAPLLRARGQKRDWIAALTARFSDPFAVLLDKELRTIIRMPRIRVVFGMACVFSILIFLPAAMETNAVNYALPGTSLYGLLLLSDALLLNIFGFDRGATQLYFATPPPLSTVILAKNTAAVIVVVVQSLAVPLLAIILQMPLSLLSVTAGFMSAAVVTVFLLSVGNIISVTMPRPIDPHSVFRRNGAGRVQLWLFCSSLGMFLLVGFAFLAQWATDRNWVLLAVLALEFAVGLLIYRFAMESTLNRARIRCEDIMAALSKSASPLGSD